MQTNNYTVTTNMTKNHFTFKRQKSETGLRGVGYPNPDTTIKHNRLVVGYINGPTWQTSDNKWSVSLTRKDSEAHCHWKWVKLKFRFDTEPEARTWLKEHAEQLIDLNLHHRTPEDGD
jgi:hypothetical protein